jgi:hypothetical protein
MRGIHLPDKDPDCKKTNGNKKIGKKKSSQGMLLERGEAFDPSPWRAIMMIVMMMIVIKGNHVIMMTVIIGGGGCYYL